METKISLNFPQQACSHFWQQYPTLRLVFQRDPFGDLLCRWTLAYCKIIKDIKVQSTLGFATMGLAANLALATSIRMMDLRQYINSASNYGIYIRG